MQQPPVHGRQPSKQRSSTHVSSASLTAWMARTRRRMPHIIRSHGPTRHDMAAARRPNCAARSTD